MALVRWRSQIGPVEAVKLSVGELDNNVYVLRGNREAVLIDGAAEPQALLDALGGLRLSRILQTHGHQDHVRALPRLVEATGAPVWCHEADARMLPVGSMPLKHGDVVELDGLQLRVVHTPGHTPGGVCFVTEGHVFSGDSLFPGGPGATWNDPKLFTMLMDALEREIFVLPGSTKVYPGHGADTTLGAERPSLGHWRSRGW